MSLRYRLWTDYPYAGETKPPNNPVDPQAGSWPTYYLIQDERGHFRNPTGGAIHFDIRDPNSIDWEGELRIVQKTLKSLTSKQIRIAKYWGTGVATKQLTPIIDRLIDTYSVTPAKGARVLSAVQAAVNDAFVVTWHLKYLWNIARPNQYDDNLAAILCTPRFPAYPSGHSVMAGCGEVILSYFFPPESSRLKKLADECAESRLYAGVHSQIDNDEGLRLGRQIGSMVVDILKNERDSNYQFIDKPILENRHAKLPPRPYKQVIPFTFNQKCKSKVKKTHANKINSKNVNKKNYKLKS